MNLLEENKKIINKKFNEVLKLSGCKKEEIIKGLSYCSEPELSLMKYLYISMPQSDLANYDFDIFLGYARHAVFLIENIDWIKEIPDDIFLNYVLYYRVNNENIEDCRKIFYNLIKDRIRNKSMMDAALEINYWCLEQMTYKSTDERTASPLASLKSAYGRCGEESTFTVTALRSAGIPARQVYVPRWSHCDDNHAWVDVFCNGKCHYFGACEPEPVMDKGWFSAAATRAMIVTSRVFSPFYNETDVLPYNKLITKINNIKRYADCRKLTVRIVNKNNKPVPDVIVNFQILNCSEFFTAASLQTDKEGKVSTTLGLGSININTVKSGRFINRLVNTKVEDFVVLNLDNAGIEDLTTDDFDMAAPADNMSFTISLKPEEKILAREMFKKSDNLRIEKESKFYDDEKANISAQKYYQGSVIIKNAFIKSKGNCKEIENFLNDSNYNLEDKIDISKVLLVKDYLDITGEMLCSHLKYSIEYKGKYPDEIYQNYIMNPRIYYENITEYRKFILDYFSLEEKKKFKDNPDNIWSYIQNNINENPEMEYDALYTMPEGALSIKCCSLMSKKILFAAICRTLGIPARINREDLSIEYFNDGNFVKVTEDKESGHAELTLIAQDYTAFIYMQNWTIGVLKDGEFKTLNLEDRVWADGKMKLLLEPGNYRIITSNRIPNGNILARKYSFILSGGEKEIKISQRKAELKDMLKNVKLQDFSLVDESESKVLAGNVLNKNINAAFWLRESAEPTEHILNEMISLKNILNSANFNIVFILKNKNSLLNEKLRETVKAIPKIKIYYDFENNDEAAARMMYLEPGELPLIIGAYNRLNVFYSYSGYNVGIIDLLLKIIKTADKIKLIVN